MKQYNEQEVVEQIRKLPLPVRSHLSHVVRNGLMNILASYEQDGVEKAIFIFEERWKELGV